MSLMPKALPPPSLRRVLDPASDDTYTHFEGAVQAPFEARNVPFLGGPDDHAARS